MTTFDRVDAIFRPIDKWPDAETEHRTRSPFSANWADTLDLLQREVSHLLKQGERPVIEIGIDESQIRLDGYPYANANPDHPGVIVTIESEEGPLRFPCDTFDRMQDNVRAIALALENLRRVDRYGVTRRHEQYRGFRALPPAGESGRGYNGMSSVEAAEVVVRSAGALPWSKGAVLADPDIFRELYRRAAKLTHPDRGGVPGAFARLNAAKRVLDAHHERKAAS